MTSVLLFFEFLRRRAFLMAWISLVVYVFYETFYCYRYERQFRYLRNILGLGLCISRGTATVLNLSCAIVLLPLCKKLNQILYNLLSKLWPKLFFFWLENAKSFHMTVGATIVLFSVLHSCSHFVNMLNFSRNFDEEAMGINMAQYKNQNPLFLLLTYPGITGVMMLIIILGMGVTSSRIVRRYYYNSFWYIHQCYLLFLVLLLLHPLSGSLKEEVLDDNDNKKDIEVSNATTNYKKFIPIKSKTLNWMAIPLLCFLLDLIWRLICRNSSKIIIEKVEHLPGRVISLSMIYLNKQFRCRSGQYVLMQCQELSLLEWHPFTVVKGPTSSQESFNIWIRVKGDWTEQLEQLANKGIENSRILLDGPFSSPMERVINSKVAICVAAGVGITPFVSVLHSLLEHPRSLYPGRIHLIWIVRYEQEITWIAKLVNNAMLQLINVNRPDRLNIEFYITRNIVNGNRNIVNDHVIIFNEKGGVRHAINRHEQNIDEERVTLLTPNMKRFSKEERKINDKNGIEENYRITKEYPLLGCRVRHGKPYWDRLMGYWAHLYLDDHLNLYCCGPKKLSVLLRKKCKEFTQNTSTKFTFINEGFS